MSERLPTDVIVPVRASMPDEFYDAIYEYLQDKYGRSEGVYAMSYGVEIMVKDITWEEL